eukprot:3618159-Amphidinium_carterae.2
MMRELFLESYAKTIGELRQGSTSTDVDPPSKLPVAERNGRLQALRLRLPAALSNAKISASATSLGSDAHPGGRR